MNNTVKSANFLSDISQPSNTGVIEMTKNSIIWQIYLVEGKIHSATHSLQSGQTIKYYLRSLGVDYATKMDFLDNQSTNHHRFPVKNIINQMQNQGHIDSHQKALLNKKITEDALEPILWLNNKPDDLIAKNQIKPFKVEEKIAFEEEHLLEIEPLISNLQHRLNMWQKINQFIVSPHQIPYCANPSFLEKSYSQGNLSINIVKQLVKLMQGLSIRELALFVRQDELKIAQLLSSYIEHEVLQLHPPKHPFNLLPEIPQYFEENLSNNEQVITKNFNAKLIKSNHKKQTIICIDDSPAMLEIIRTYLDSDKYDLITIEEPMQSLSYLFKSNPDLILMDISMPGINGNRLCQILKSSSVFKSVPIILISGESKILNQEILQSTGAKDFLVKPFSKEQLQEMLNKHCLISLD